MISVRFPYALTSHAAQPELGCNALDASEGLSETDIHHVVIRHRLLKSLDMGSIWITDAIADLQRPVSVKRAPDSHVRRQEEATHGFQDSGIVTRAIKYSINNMQSTMHLCQFANPAIDTNSRLRSEFWKHHVTQGLQGFSFCGMVSEA